MTTPQADENNLKQSAKEIITSIIHQGRWGTTDTHDTDTNDDTLEPHEDFMGTKLWDFIQPLPRHVGTILYYIWRAGLDPSETAAHDYKIALIYLKELNPNAAITVPQWFLETDRFKKLYNGKEELAPYGVSQAKANMLHHYTRMLKHPGVPESTQYFYQRKHHYDALREALEDAIEAETRSSTNKEPTPETCPDILGMDFWKIVKPLPFTEGNVLKRIWQAGTKDGVPASEDYTKALAYLKQIDHEQDLQLPDGYFDDVPLEYLRRVEHGRGTILEAREKLSMLHHFFNMLLYRNLTEAHAKYPRKHHYEALQQELVDATK